MPVFEIESGGKVFEVDAPDQTAALAALGQQPQGKVTLSDVGNQALADIKSFPGKVWNAVKGIPQIPARAGEAVQQYQQTGEYNPAPFMEAAALASPVNPAIRAGDKIIPGVGRATKTVAPKAPTAQQLVESSDSRYKTARELGVEFNPETTKNWSLGVQRELDEQGFIDAPKVASGTHDILKRLHSIPAPEPGMPPTVQTVSNLDALRRSLRAVAQDYSNKSDRAAATIAIDRLDQFLSSPPKEGILAGASSASKLGDEIAKARGDYAAAMRSNSITGELDDAYTGILDRGELRAAVANSGQNVGNTLRQRIAGLLSNRKGLGGYSKEEIAALERAAVGTPGMNASRWVGNVMGGGGGLGAQITSALAAGTGALVGGVPGAAAGATAGPIIGAGAKAIEGSLTKKAINSANEMILKRSPLFQEMSPIVTGVSPEKRAAIIRLLAGLSQQPAQ